MSQRGFTRTSVFLIAHFYINRCSTFTLNALNAHFKSSHVPDFFPSSSAAGSLSVKRAHQSYRHLATKDEVTPPHRTGERVRLTEPRSPCPLHSHRAACREAASPTHQPDVSERIRSQLALSVPSRGHPLSAGGSYIPHAPTHKNNNRLSTPVERPRTLLVQYYCFSSCRVWVLKRSQPHAFLPAGVTSRCSYGLFPDRKN